MKEELQSLSLEIRDAVLNAADEMGIKRTVEEVRVLQVEKSFCCSSVI